MCIYRKTTELLVIDTQYHDPYYYNTLKVLARNSGIHTRVIPWYQLKPYDYQQAAIIYLEPTSAQVKEYLSEGQEPSFLSFQFNETFKHLMSHINETCKPCIIGISSVKNSDDGIKTYHAFINEMITAERKHCAPILKHLLTSPTHKTYLYDTALLAAHRKSNSYTYYPSLDTSTLLQSVPLCTKNISEKLQPLLPIGAIFAKHSHLALISADYLHALAIHENFTLNPLNQALREHFIALLCQTWNHILLTICKKPCMPINKKSSIPIELTSCYEYNHFISVQEQRKKTVHHNYRWITKEGIRCAWMNLTPFNTAHNQRQHEIAKNILQSRVNMLWLEIMPEIYLGRRSTRTANELRTWLNSIKKFTACLKRAAHETQLPIPHLMLGMELTWNFGRRPPTYPARDITGAMYSNIPSPLAQEEFWQDEVVEVFQKFYNYWQTFIGNGLPLAGAFLDLEMYHATNQAGQFFNNMDFSEHTWQKFLTSLNNRTLKLLDTHEKRITYLFKHQLIPTYFDILHKEAMSIGKFVKNGIRKILPNALIGVYNVTLPYNWFYKGFCTGLSSAAHPVIMATFNLNAYNHRHWLTKEQIHMFHMPPIMLSKLRTVYDFNLIPMLSCHHDGVWFNRFSQLEEPIKDHTNVEVSPLITKTVIKQLEYWSNKDRKKRI